MKYTTAQLLSMTTGRLVCDLGALYAVASGLLGRDVFTHELPAAFEECRPWVLAHVPQLEGITGDDVTPANWQQWVAGKVSELGDGFEVPPLTYSAIREKSPLETLRDVAGDKPVMVVEVEP